jgi:hypothetical protein
VSGTRLGRPRQVAVAVKVHVADQDQVNVDLSALAGNRKN